MFRYHTAPNIDSALVIGYYDLCNGEGRYTLWRLAVPWIHKDNAVMISHKVENNV
jgi:hypothetical protein